ncbi:nucleotide sugar dehydrogenase [Candidatus Nitrosotenuis aquarius]|uniref:nucleotide sugar dehydrogenase n=1 Tax=Candidatus Nitrosotenuis aquarius TaxID=1846278 RepID=UPI001FE8767D|nr:nucleotide sugar dehydrogenase [Candidatus Nitrosotenuis aquarius]
MTKKKPASIITNKKIAVYGLGNVGGPLAAAWLRAGANVIGVDVSTKLLTEIRNGESHKKEPFISEIFSTALKNNKLSLTSDGIQASKDSQIKIVAVPVALKNNKIDLSIIITVAQNITRGLKKNDTVIICPSLPPGTTEKIILPILEKSKLKGEKDFCLIYNPERIYEGRALQDIEENYPAIVSGLGKKSTDLAQNLLSLISKKGVLTMSSLATAEAEKLFEGVYRDVNIALANELVDFCKDVGINYWEARKAANSQPYCHLHYPGTGVGGLCIPVYPRFVIEQAAKLGKNMKITEFARKINDDMPIQCVKDAIRLLKNNKKTKNLKIAVLGLGFRGDVTDSRLSPSYAVINEFRKKKLRVSVHDPYILQDDDLPSNVELSSDLGKTIHKADLIFISTDHKQYSKLDESSFSKANKPLLIFDGRNILNKNNFNNSKLLTIGIP